MYLYKCLWKCSPLKKVKVFNINVLPWESEDQKSLEDHKSPEDYKSLEDYKKHRKPQDHEESRKPGKQDVSKSQEVLRSQRSLPGLKNPESQESGRLAAQRSKNQENNS